MKLIKIEFGNMHADTKYVFVDDFLSWKEILKKVFPDKSPKDFHEEIIKSFSGRVVEHVYTNYDYISGDDPPSDGLLLREEKFTIIE